MIRELMALSSETGDVVPKSATETWLELALLIEEKQ